MNRSSQACEWLDLHSDATVQELADLVAIPGISTDGMHGTELERSAGMVASLAEATGFPEVEIIRPEDGYPAVLASWVVDPAASTFSCLTMMFSRLILLKNGDRNLGNLLSAMAGCLAVAQPMIKAVLLPSWRQ